MRECVKKQFVMILVTLAAVFAVGMWLPWDTYEVKAADELYTVSDVAGLEKIIEKCDNGVSDRDYVVELDSDMEISDDNLGSGQVFKLTKGVLTLDLKGHKIDGSKCSKSGTVFYNLGGTLTIIDSVGSGKIVSPNNGVIIRTEAGNLNIAGGTFENASQCLSIENSIVNITGGTFKTDGNGSTDIALMVTGDNSIVKVSGNSNFESAYTTIWVKENVKSDSSLTIEDGTFQANEKDEHSYVCYIGGSCNLNVNGGTFRLNGNLGSTFFIDAATTDAQVNITGGVYNGRIARGVSDSSRMNYTAFYGDNNGNDGIFGAGCILTDNTFYSQGNIMFSQGNVKVVSGFLLRLNTRRSALEAYSSNENALADTADYYSLAPISVGIDGTVYSNSDSNVTPVVDTGRVTDGNVYEFSGWCSENGKEYTFINEYITEQGGLSADKVLGAVWKSKVHTPEGLEKAVNNSQAVKNIELTDNISLTSSMIEDGQTAAFGQRTLDLSGKVVSYEGVSSSDPAFVLNGVWNIKNGTIISKRQACIQVGGTAVIENLNCKTQDFSYAVGFSNVTAASLNKIISGTFETTSTDGYALWTTNGNGIGTAADITNLFKDSNASCTNTRVDGTNVYLTAPKLIVSQSPITYIDNNADVNLGNHTYGEMIAAVTQTINNMGCVGDIVVTGVSVDNAAFTVTGESTGKSLLGGSTDTYNYEIKATGNPAPGTYEGIVSVNYLRMDGTAGVCSQKVVMTVVPKQLTITEPTLTKTKTYDGKTTAAITVGALNGVISGDDVSVTAVAKYNSATAGSGKTISVAYALTGAAKDRYLAPAGAKYTGGVINKAAGKASVSIADYHVGEKAKAKISSSTNGTKSVKFHFKSKGAADSTYTTTVPSKEGSYTVKAVFAATTNYKAVEATANFKVSYIATPKQPYTLKGTKGKNGWYISNVTINPAKGYSISNKQSGTYKSSYTVESTAQPVIYLKDDNGAVTKGINVEKIQIDKALPQISGIRNGETHYEDELKAVVSDSNLSSVTLNGKSISFDGQSVTVSLKPSDTKYTLAAWDKAGNKVEYTVRVEDSWMKDGVVSDGKKKLIKKKSYKLGSGQWKVSGDNTVYNGNMNFYVSADGEYDFKKQ